MYINVAELHMAHTSNSPNFIIECIN